MNIAWPTVKLSLDFVGGKIIISCFVAVMEGVSRIIRKKCFDISVEEIKNILFDEDGVLSRVWFLVQGLLQLLIKVAVEQPARVPIVVVEACVLKSEERKATVFVYFALQLSFSLVG